MTQAEKRRKLLRIVPGLQTSDGAGVKLRRSIGSSQNIRLDPFLMLDEFGTENPDDYIAGFPPHPHRGFETVTYMIDGHMRHEDHLGNVGELKSGGVQWMTAGKQESQVPVGHNAFVYAYEGTAKIGGQNLPQQAAGILSDGSQVEIVAGPEPLRLVLIAGKPLHEPVVQYGPFVMNTREEIEQAIQDYQLGRLIA